MTLKVMTIFGTRPEAIKMAPLIKELEKRKEIDSKVIVTAQHRKMLDQVLDLFNIKPDYDLNIMKDNQSLTGITNRVLTGLENIFEVEKPDLVLVHGDTSTTFAASLAAYYKKIKVGHVEAGLRTFNKYFPYPEEMNRKLTGQIADIHFAPTINSYNNLIREGVNEEDIFITGNTVIDAMKYTVNKDYNFKNNELNKIDFKNKKVIMVTAHRRENWGEGIENICTSLKKIVEENKDVHLVYLVHLNPVVKNVVDRELRGIDRVTLLPPLDTEDTHNLMNKCYMIMTDSGGIQEEGPSLGKPVIVLRNVTERPEAVESGTVRLAGTNKDKIINIANDLINDKLEYEKMNKAINPYGDGKASERITDAILYKFNISNKRPSEFKDLNKREINMETELLNIKEKEIETFSKIDDLKEDVDETYKSVCIFGQGFVGLPLSLSFAIRGCNVLGVDVDEKLIKNTNNGLTHHTERFYDISIQDILNMELDSKRYRATSNGEEAVKKSNNVIVTVGIPIKDDNYIMDYLEDAARVIGRNLKKDDLVVIRSTVIPGTTEDFILPILEKESKMKAGIDFYLAYASERIAEGKAFDEFANMPTLVGGVNEESTKRAAKLLGIVCKADIVQASCIKAVETSKVFENVQRDVNIAMSQEFARFTEELGIDIHEVVKLANTHKRVNLLIPGPGVGGYCIPNAYHYIAPKAKEMGINMDILKLSRIKNAALPQFIVDKTEELLNKQGKQLKDSNVAVLGLAMKDYSNDDRISPSIDICKLLIEKGAIVKAYDPVVPTKYNFKVDSQDIAMKNSDAVLILTKQHDMEFDDFEHMSKVLNKQAIFIDTKAVANEREARKYGITVWRI